MSKQKVRRVLGRFQGCGYGLYCLGITQEEAYIIMEAYKQLRNRGFLALPLAFQATIDARYTRNRLVPSSINLLGCTIYPTLAKWNTVL